MLEAFQKVLSTKPKTRLKLLSEDSSDKVMSSVGEFGLTDQVTVELTAFEELPAKLAECDILLNPRLDGAGLPIKLLNYMAAEKPIVSFAGSSHVLEHLETGWIVLEGTMQAFSSGIEAVIEDIGLRYRLGQNARKYVSEHHVWSANAEIISEIYRKLLNQDNGSHAGSK